MPYETSAELVAGQIFQRLTVLWTNGVEDFMKFERLSTLKVFISLIDHSLKLRLTGTNLRNDIENSSELNPEVFYKGQIWGEILKILGKLQNEVRSLPDVSRRFRGDF